MSDELHSESKRFLATVALSPADLGLYSALRQVKGITNDEAVSSMVAFCLQFIASEFPNLSAEGAFDGDLERALFKLTALLKQLGLVLAGAEKVLLDAAALREQLSRHAAIRP